MLSLKQAFLRRIDELQVVSPQRSAGRQRRYTRIEIRVIQQVATMADEGMTMPAIRRIIELEQQLAEVVGQRDDLAARLSQVSAERVRLAHQLAALLRRPGADERRTSRPRGQPPSPPRTGRKLSRTDRSSIVEGTGSSFPFARPRIVFRRIFPERVLGSPGTMSSLLSVAMGPMRSRISWASSAASRPGSAGRLP